MGVQQGAILILSGTCVVWLVTYAIVEEAGVVLTQFAWACQSNLVLEEQGIQHLRE